MLSIIIPTNSEEKHLSKCLSSLLSSDATVCPVEIVVVASHDTVKMARSFEDRAAARGWQFQVLTLEKFDRIRALNAGDATAKWPWRAYMSDMVTVSPKLLDQLCRALDGPKARYAYASVSLNVQGVIGRTYAAAYRQVSAKAPCIQGCELFAVNAAGRVRWNQFPDVVSENIYVKLLFNPEERVELPSTYDWVMVDDFQALVQVRVQQELGRKQLKKHYPDLVKQNKMKTTPGPKGLLALGVKNPFGFIVYVGFEFMSRIGSRRYVG